MVVVVGVVDGRGGYGWCCGCFFGKWRSGRVKGDLAFRCVNQTINSDKK